MVRFARAKGSKASNERVPEEATSWREMKQQLIEKNEQVVEKKKKQEADKQKVKNYKTFLKTVEEEQSKTTQWADFSKDKPVKRGKTGEKNNQSLGLTTSKRKKPLKIVKEKSEKVKQKLEESEHAEGPVKKKPKVSDKPKPETPTHVKKPTKKMKKASANQTPTKKIGKNKVKKTQSPPKEPVDLSTLPEEDRHKIEKKKQKKLRQIVKKKLHKKPEKKKKKTTRRKNLIETMTVNGIEIDIAYMDGFPVKKEDAERLDQLRKQMIAKGLPRSEIKVALKLERRKAEKALAREKKNVCFNCRKSGHNLSECPALENQVAETAGTGICFKCGSTEHTHFECKVVRGQEFKFAQCFICREQGHIARQCPDNARGLYPKGGACKVCGDVTHLKRDCPTYQTQQHQTEKGVHVETLSVEDNPDSLGGSERNVKGTREGQQRVNKIIKF